MFENKILKIYISAITYLPTNEINQFHFLVEVELVFLSYNLHVKEVIILNKEQNKTL